MQSSVPKSLITTSNKGNISSRFSSNSEAVVSELLEDHEEIFPWFYLHGNIFNILNYSPTN